MKTIWKMGALLTALGLALPLRATAAAARSDEPNENAIAAVDGIAAGLGVNVPLVGRLTGGGNTLYISTVDVTNNTATDTQVDFYLNGQDLANGAAIAKVGSISSTGTLVAQGAGGSMRHRSNAHFADFIDAVVQSGILPASVETDGFIGSVLFVFNGFNKLDQGAATVRFYNSFGGGSIGQSLKGHDVAAAEPQTVVATFRDSRSQAVEPQLYANLFINNTGLTPAGAGTSASVTVRLQAYANSTGNATGNTKDLTIGAGQTASVSDVLHALAVPAGEDTVLVTATVTSGDAAIAGAAVEIDQTTKDGSVVDANRGDF
jgi:hypothetical protein